MIGLEHIWGAVGMAIGVVVATICLVAAQIRDEYRTEKEKCDGCKRG